MNLHKSFLKILKIIYHNFLFIKWRFYGSQIPPPHIAKRKYLSKTAKDENLNVFIETGTFKGDMIYSLKNKFKQLYSIEVSHNLYLKAQKRFSGIDKIKIIEGDSAIKLNEIVNKINESALFWLDAHCSEGITSQGEKYTPILEEILIILNSKFSHIIVIDDARLFGQDINYPTFNDLSLHIKKIGNNYKIKIFIDFIVISK